MRKIQKLLSDWLLIDIEPEKKVTASGIIVPDTVGEPVRVGTIKMTGPGRDYRDKFVSIALREGDRVAFMIGASQTKQGRELRQRLEMDSTQELIRQGDVLFVIEDNGPISITGNP
jgi:co-chaperonin GroES (HSP10)